MNDGEAGLSATTEAWYVDSIEEAELGYLICRAEKVGVTGEAASEVDEVCVCEVARSTSESDMLSRFLRSSTSCGSNSGFSFGDIMGRCCAGCARSCGVDRVFKGLLTTS